MKPTPEKRFVPNPHINEIKYRVPRREISILPNSPIEANFKTWEEAHAWLVARRANSVEAAKTSLASAERHLAKAKKMQAKSEWRTP
jgi:hypothetical protein